MTVSIPPRRGKPYREGELETVLQMPATKSSIEHLAKLLDRSPAAIELIYRFAYGFGTFGNTAVAQRRKIHAAKLRVGLALGRKTIQLD